MRYMLFSGIEYFCIILRSKCVNSDCFRSPLLKRTLAVTIACVYAVILSKSFCFIAFKPHLYITITWAVFSLSFSVWGELLTAAFADECAVCLSVYTIGMSVPPLMTALIRAEQPCLYLLTLNELFAALLAILLFAYLVLGYLTKITHSRCCKPCQLSDFHISQSLSSALYNSSFL